MSNVSIFEKKWLDLVFDGKNKAYGAYQLRRQSTRTTFMALFSGMLFIGSLTAMGLLLSSFGNHPPAKFPEKHNDSTITVVDLQPRIKEPETKIEKPKTNTGTDQPVIKNQPIVVVQTHHANPDIPETPTTPQTNVSPTDHPGNGGAGVDPANGGGGTDSGATIVTAPAGPMIAKLLDKQPEYPGGIDKFYNYVGRNFKDPEVANLETISVNVSFVIEKDGSMTDIKVLRNPGYGLDKEAIRVLKSLKTKWTPGVKDGNYVRTQYTLPITIKLN